MNFNNSSTATVQTPKVELTDEQMSLVYDVAQQLFKAYGLTNLIAIIDSDKSSKFIKSTVYNSLHTAFPDMSKDVLNSITAIGLSKSITLPLTQTKG